MKIGEIRELIRLLDETSLTELKLETDDVKLLLKKGETMVVGTSVPSLVAPAAAPASIPSSAAAPVVANPAAQETPKTTEQADTETGVHYIKAPMVGTFYRAPSPDADPYVAKGQQVNQKSVVCIVEAMKLMNEIEAEVSGEVLDVLVENGQLVEYGQPLVKIKLS